MHQGTGNVSQFTPRDDTLVIAEFAGIFVKDLSQIDKVMQLYSSSGREMSCPFRDGKCIKICGRPTGRPLPLCSIRLKSGSYLAVCHERIANEVVIRNLIKELNLEAKFILSNVRLPSGRSYDFLVVAQERNTNTNDGLKLLFLEVITVDTTNTGSLLRLLQGEMHRHNMYINWENVRKREVLQMLYKDIIVKRIANMKNIIVDIVKKIANIYDGIDICYIGIIQSNTFNKLFKDSSTYKLFNEFCSEYANYNKSIGFLLFTMLEYDNRLDVRLDDVRVVVVDLEKLIGAHPEVIERDTEGLLDRLQMLINGNTK